MENKKQKVWTYSPFHSFTIIKVKGWEGKKITMQTQLYQIGIYCIYDNNAAKQCTFETPAPIIKLQKQLRKAQEEGKITDLYFSPEIKVIRNVEGFLEQI